MDRLGLEGSQSSEPPKTPESLIDANQTLPFTRGRWALEGKSNQEMTAAIRENFMHGDRVYVALNDKIGDMVQGSAFIASLNEAKRVLDVKTPITLLVPSYPLRQIYAPLAKRFGMDIIPSARMQSIAQGHLMSLQNGEKNILEIELDHFEGEPWVGKDPADGAVAIRDIFNKVNALYDNTTGGRARYSKFTERFLGLKEGSLSPDRCLPFIPLPEKADQIYKEYVDKYRIDPSKKQIAVCLEASTTGRMYDKWDQVIAQLKSDFGNTAEINIVYNPNKPPDDPTGINESYWKNIVSKYTGVRLISGPLNEMGIVLANQSIVVATDSGLSHLAGAVEDGPKTIALYIPPQTEERTWATNPDRMIGISAPMEGRDPNPAIGNDVCKDPAKKWVNLVPPEAIVTKAKNLMRTVYEAPMHKGNPETAIASLYQEILSRSPNPQEIRYYISSGKSITTVATEMRNSDEKRKLDMQRLYATMLRRPADPEGLQNYINHLKNGKKLGEIKKEIAQSSEYRDMLKRASAGDKTRAIEDTYRAILGREIYPDEKKAYTSPVTIEEVLNSLLKSQEYKLGQL